MSHLLTVCVTRGQRLTAWFTRLEPMRHIQTLSALVLFVTMFLIFFYSTLHLETAYSLRLGPEDLQKEPSLQVHDADGKAQPSKQERFTTPPPAVLNVSIADGLRQAIPQSGAYWNRLLYSALGDLVKGDNLIGRDSDWSLCRQTNQEHLQTNVHDFTSYPVLFQDFVQAMNCKSPPVLLNQPNKCNSDNQTFLLFTIKSTPGNFEQRQVVRETWGREGVHLNGLRVHTVFLLGSSSPEDPDLSSLLSFEAIHFRDLLQWDFHESLLNLTLKMNMFLQWTVKYCPAASFVFSGDDDVFVNTPTLLSYLQSLELPKASKLYTGQVITEASPLRDPKNKYYIPPSFYDGQYPGYAGGGGFIISGALLPRLYSASRLIPFFPIDDVYVGMCFKALGISPELNTDFKTFDINEKDRNNLCVNKKLILIHRRTARQIKNLWKGIHNPLLIC